MRITPIIDNIITNGLNPDDNRFNWTRYFATLAVTWFIVFPILIVMLVFMTDGEMGTRVIGSTVIGLLVALPTTFTAHRFCYSEDNLNLMATLNKGRLTPKSIAPEEFANNSAIRMAALSTEKDKFENDPSNVYLNGLVRSDGKGPHFFAGRLRSYTGAYKNYLMVCVQLPEAYPQVLIDYDGKGSKGMTRFDSQLQPKQKFELEGNFADNFTLYAATPNIARFATYVLTPEVMEGIMQLTPSADIEIVDNQLILIWKSPNTTWAGELPEVFFALNTVAAKLYERVTKYQRHADDKLDDKLRFSFVPQIKNTARMAARSVNGDAGLLIDAMRRKGFWLMWIGILLFIAIVAIIGAMLV